MFKVQIISERLKVFDKKDNKELFSLETKEKNMEFDSHGLYGIINFENIEVMIFITKASKVGEINSNDVLMVNEAKSVILKSGKNIIDDIALKNSIDYYFCSSGMYFSETELYLPQVQSKSKSVSLKDETKYTFLYNLIPLKNALSKINTLEFNTPVFLKSIQGYFSQKDDLSLISRRSPKYTGMRYFARGINRQGYPSNFVETEQILGASSYIQVRGSIPLAWSHKISAKYRPEILIDLRDMSGLARKSHKILSNIYQKPIFYLNLISNKGYESDLFFKFNSYFKSIGNFYNFNFSKSIKKMPFPIDFTTTGITSDRQYQKIVIRTNCIDCLDRTNSMQYLIGKEMLQMQLDEIGIKEDMKRKSIEIELSRMYYENGNAISNQYAGTDAMSSYYITNKGKTFLGLIKDLKISLTRYFINRYNQGSYTDMIRVVSGTVTKGTIPVVPRFSVVKIISIILLPFVMISTVLLFPKKSHLSTLIISLLAILFTQRIFFKYDLSALQE